MRPIWQSSLPAIESSRIKFPTVPDFFIIFIQCVPVIQCIINLSYRYFPYNVLLNTAQELMYWSWYVRNWLTTNQKLISYKQFIHSAYSTTWWSQSELRIVKIHESSTGALFLYNCTLHAREHSVWCIHARVGLMHLLFGLSYLVSNIYKTF